MKTQTQKLSPFQMELLNEVIRIQRECRKDGTTGLGLECLFQHLQFRNLDNAPIGTNARYFIMQDLREVTARFFPTFILSLSRD